MPEKMQIIYIYIGKYTKYNIETYTYSKKNLVINPIRRRHHRLSLYVALQP